MGPSAFACTTKVFVEHSRSQPYCPIRCNNAQNTIIICNCNFNPHSNLQHTNPKSPIRRPLFYVEQFVPHTKQAVLRWNLFKKIPRGANQHTRQ